MNEESAIEKTTTEKMKDSLNYELQKLQKERQEIIDKLQKIANFSESEAKALLIKQIEAKHVDNLSKLTKDLTKKTEQNLKTKVNKILATAIERCASEGLAKKTVSKIELGDSKLKGKIIGKDGRNIQAFEDKSGVDIVMEKDSNTIKFSCFDPIRREIAKRAMKKLIEDGRIQPQKIEEFLRNEAKNINLIIIETGRKIANELKVFDLNEEILKLLGTLKYRTSYGQNVLEHSIEVAKLAGILAEELDLNSQLAVRGGLLHDIGKALDFKIDKTHVQLGVEVAEKNQESDTVINIIASHHGDVEANNIYSLLVSAADTISAAREGARDNVQEDYIKRMKTIEKTCRSIPGVKNSFAVKSGRVIRIFVDPHKINDYQAEQIADQIAQKLKKELKMPGEVVIKIIRELEIERII